MRTLRQQQFKQIQFIAVINAHNEQMFAVNAHTHTHTYSYEHQAQSVIAFENSRTKVLAVCRSIGSVLVLVAVAATIFPFYHQFLSYTRLLWR